MRKALTTGLTWSWVATVELLHFIVYITARVLKTPLWWITIDEFAIWRDWREQIDRDIAIVLFLTLGTTGFIFLSWWWFLIALGFGAFNLIVFLIWMLIRSRMKGTDTGTEIAVLKSKWKR